MKVFTPPRVNVPLPVLVMLPVPTMFSLMAKAPPTAWRASGPLSAMSLLALPVKVSVWPTLAGA